MSDLRRTEIDGENRWTFLPRKRRPKSESESPNLTPQSQESQMSATATRSRKTKPQTETPADQVIDVTDTATVEVPVAEPVTEPTVEAPANTEATPAQTPPATPTETPAPVTEMKFECPKCKGSGKFNYQNGNTGGCYRCASDPTVRNSPGKGTQDRHDLLRNMLRDAKANGVRWTFLVKAVIDGVAKTTHRHLSSGTELFVRNDDGSARQIFPADAKVGDRIFTPKMAKKPGPNPGDPERWEAVDLLVGEIMEKQEVKSPIAF